MKLIKEFCPFARTVVIRSDSYGSRLFKFLEMLKAAQQDFPIDSSDVTIVHFGGERYARTFGIEFSADDAPEEYVRIEQLEYTR